MEDLLLTSGIRPNWSIPLVGRTEELSLLEPLTDKITNGQGTNSSGHGRCGKWENPVSCLKHVREAGDR